MKIFGATGNISSVEEAMKKVKKFEEQCSSTTQIFRADRIFGELHLRSAVEHAQRAFEQGRNRSRDLGTETLLYCAAERQIKNAIELLGITEEINEIAIIIIGEGSEDELLATLGLRRDDTVLEGEKDFKFFGISDAEVRAVGKERITDLILERIALSELDR